MNEWILNDKYTTKQKIFQYSKKQHIRANYYRFSIGSILINKLRTRLQVHLILWSISNFYSLKKCHWVSLLCILILFQIKLLLSNNLIWSLIKLFKISIQMHMHFKTEKKICLCVVKEDTYCLKVWILISYMYA